MTEAFYHGSRTAGRLLGSRTGNHHRAVPGRKAPILITREMVPRMSPGSLNRRYPRARGQIADSPARAETIVSGGVTSWAAHLPSTIPLTPARLREEHRHVPQVLIKEANSRSIAEDEIVREPVRHAGEVVHPKVAN